MYESFFEMEHTPFTRDIPIDRLYTSPRIEDALGRLVYVVDHQMFAVVTANPGCGKSTMVRMLNGRLGKEKYLGIVDKLLLKFKMQKPRFFELFREFALSG